MKARITCTSSFCTDPALSVTKNRSSGGTKVVEIPASMSLLKLVNSASVFWLISVAALKGLQVWGLMVSRTVTGVARKAIRLIGRLCWSVIFSDL